MPRVERESAAPKMREIKIRRPSIRPLEEWVDGFMRGLSMAVIDPAKPETQVKLRQYVTQWMRHCLQSTASDLRRGAERGIEQTMDFMFDPQHDRSTKARRKAKAQKKAIRLHDEMKTKALKEIPRGPIQ